MYSNIFQDLGSWCAHSWGRALCSLPQNKGVSYPETILEILSSWKVKLVGLTKQKAGWGQEKKKILYTIERAPDPKTPKEPPTDKLRSVLGELILVRVESDQEGSGNWRGGHNLEVIAMDQVKLEISPDS